MTGEQGARIATHQGLLYASRSFLFKEEYMFCCCYSIPLLLYIEQVGSR